MPETLIEALRNAATVTERGYTFLDDALEPHEWSFKELHAETVRRGRYLRSLGLQKGDRLAMVIPEGEDFVLTFLGAIQAGVIPVPMYPPLALGKLDTYAETARRIAETSGAKILVTTKQISNILWSLVAKVPSLEDIHTVEKMTARLARLGNETGPSLDDLTISGEDTCFLQFTSGSTSHPKGVIVTHANLMANSKAIMIDGLNSDGEKDKGVSWLPLYHDMGLIGFVIAPLLNTVPIVFIPTITFIKRPNSWMDTISKYRGTITFGPNFAIGLASKRATPKRVASMDLSSLRCLGCGAEPINSATMRVFIDTFAPAGFSENALMPAYGMAEATLAISFDDLSRPFKTLTIDREAYESLHKAVLPAGEDVLQLVSCGKTFLDHEVRIMGDQGQFLSDGEVGEIVFSGPSITTGYFQNEDATRVALRNGWLHTGDLGFMTDGEVYISGRMKDLIILNGRNYHPQAIEWEVEQVDGVRLGNVVAFSTRGDETEQLVVVAETKLQDEEKRSALNDDLKKRVRDNLGLSASEIQLLPPGALPKTSSGKVQRARTKRMFENGSLGEAGNRTMGSTAARLALAKHLTSSAFARLSHEIGRPARSARRWVTSMTNQETPR